MGIVRSGDLVGSLLADASALASELPTLKVNCIVPLAWPLHNGRARSPLPLGQVKDLALLQLPVPPALNHGTEIPVSARFATLPESYASPVPPFKRTWRASVAKRMIAEKFASTAMIPNPPNMGHAYGGLDASNQ